MKRFWALLAASLIGMATAGAAVAECPGRPAEPVPLPQPEAVEQATKFVDVKNDSRKSLRVYLLYVGDADGEVAWLPGGGGANEPLCYRLEPGELCRLGVAGEPILTTRIRIWAETDTEEWVPYRDKDMVLVEEPYTAPEPKAMVVRIGS